MPTVNCAWQPARARFSAEASEKPHWRTKVAPDAVFPPWMTLPQTCPFAPRGRWLAVPCQAINVSLDGIFIAFIRWCDVFFDSVFFRGHCTLSHLLSLAYLIGSLWRFFDVIRRHFIFLFIMVTCY